MTETEAEAITTEQRAIVALDAERDVQRHKLLVLAGITIALERIIDVDVDDVLRAQAGRFAAILDQSLNVHRGRMHATELKLDSHIGKLKQLAPELVDACTVTGVTRRVAL